MPSVLCACFNRLTHLISCILHVLLPLYLFISVCACNNQLRTQSVAVARSVRVHTSPPESTTDHALSYCRKFWSDMDTMRLQRNVHGAASQVN